MPGPNPIGQRQDMTHGRKERVVQRLSSGLPLGCVRMSTERVGESFEHRIGCGEADVAQPHCYRGSRAHQAGLNRGEQSESFRGA